MGEARRAVSIPEGHSAYIQAVVGAAAGLPHLLDAIAAREPSFCRRDGEDFAFTTAETREHVNLEPAFAALQGGGDAGRFFPHALEATLASLAEIFEERFIERGWTVMTGLNGQAHLMTENLLTLATTPYAPAPESLIVLMADDPGDEAYLRRLARWLAEGLAYPALYAQAVSGPPN